jgi:hypothetical protein
MRTPYAIDATGVLRRSHFQAEISQDKQPDGEPEPVTTKTLPNSTTTAYYYNGSGVTLVNTGIQGAPGASGMNFGFVVAGNNDTLVNNGTVFGQRVAVYVTGSGDSVINAAGKKITATEADQAGVNFYNFSGTLTNYGIISGYANSVNGGPAGNAVELEHGGVVTNFGTLQNGGVLVGGAAGTVVNSGVILGNAAYGGVYMRLGGQVTNLAGGLISANGATASYEGAPPYGVFIHGGAGTVTNAGTINGNTGNAVDLAAGFQNRLIVDPGAAFVGAVSGGTAADATLELASSASTGTLSGFGTQFTNFGTVTFDPSASWLVKASTAISSAVINGFAANDTIDLTGFVVATKTLTGNTLVLTNASNAHVTLHVSGTLSTSNFALVGDGATGTDIEFQAAASSTITAGSTVSFTGGGAPVTLDSGLIVADAGGTLVGATISIGSGFLSGDVLNFATQNGISGTFDAGTGTLTLSGTATVLNYEAALDSIGYSFNPADGDPTHGGSDTSRTIDWVVTDGSAVSNTGTSTLHVSASSALTYGQTIDETGIVATTETVTAGVMTLRNGASQVGTIAVGNSVSSGFFTLASDGSGGTDVIVSTVFGTYSSGVTLLTNPTTIASTAQVANSIASSSGITGPAGTAWTLTNLGTVTDSGAGGHGISLGAGGTIINAVSGMISAASGVNIIGAGQVTNQGTIVGTTSSGIYLATGSVTNAAGAAITGGSDGVVVHSVNASVTNLGQITATVANGSAISLSNGGVVINGQGGVGTSTASLQGAFGIRFTTVNGPNERGTLTNFGTVIGTGSLAAAVVQLSGGAVYNGQSGATGALIQGVQYAIYNGGIVESVVNFGTVQATGTLVGGYGIQTGGGTVTNLGSSAVIAGHGGIKLAANGTVTNAGTIESTLGTAGVAVTFGTGTNRLIADPGAVFVGSVSANAASTSVVELASASSAGILAGFGTSITNFTSLVFDSGAQWTVAGNDSANGLGTLGIGGFTAGDTIDLTGFAAANRTFSNNSLVLGDGVGNFETLAIQGNFSARNFVIASDGNGGTDITEQNGLFYGDTVDEAGIVAASETVTSGVMTLFNSGGTAVGTINVGASLSSGFFTLQSDGSGGTDVIVNTVFGTYATGVTLLTDTTTIASTATISGTGASTPGIYGPVGTVWTLTNQGLISETGEGSYGISFASAGTITNAGTIAGYQAGIVLTAGGSVTNQSDGTISGFDAVDAKNNPATVVNAGVIAGKYTANNADGVYLQAGGSVTNQSGGTISGDNNGIRIAGGTGTVVNLGVVHSNDIPGQNGGAAIYLADGGVVTNGASGGTASAAYILGYRYGVQFGASAAGTLTNFGTISGNPGNPAVLLTTGTLINGPSGATGALIEGGDQTNAVLINGVATVVNYARIVGVENPGDTAIYYGVRLGGASGSLSNLGANALIENYIGVYATMNDTVTNAGTIASNFSGGAYALVFGGGTNRLILDPGARFIGAVSGGGPVTVAPSENTTVIGTANGIGVTTLELASASSAGTLSGLGTSIVNFASLVFDNGAQWTVSGNDSASGLGTLGITGFTFGDTIDLTGFVATSRTFGSDTLVLTDAGGAHETLALQGTFSTGNVRIASDGSGGTDISLQLDLAYGQTIDQAGIVATAETVSAGVMTLRNGASTVGTIAVGGTLNTSDFTLRSDGAGGTDVIVSTVFGTYTSGVTLLTNPTTIANTANISAANGKALFGAGGSPGWTINNYGVIDGGTNAYGIQLGTSGATAGSGIITNAAGGTISGRYGIRLYNSATFSIVNLAGGTIAATGTNADRAIDLEIGAGTVTNAGLITAQTTGPFDVGVELDGGGTVINTASGTISGAWGVLVAGAGTVVNAGTISGVSSNEFAVALSNGDRLIADPGAVFIGAVNGAWRGGGSTLELASAASAGTLTATNFTNFSTIEFDTGAAWTLAGATTALSGAIVGFTFGDTIDLTGFAAVNQTFMSNSLVLGNGAGSYDTLAIQGNFSTGNFRITNDGSGGTDITEQLYLPYGLTVDEAGIVVASETVADGVMTLFNSGATAVGSISVGTSLASGDFTLQSDGDGGTDVIVSTVFGTYTNGVTLLTNPTTIASTASIGGTVSGTPGVFGPAGTAWNLTNDGTINDTGSGGTYGISFAGSGTIVNAAGGVIYGTGGGIFVQGAGATVTNLGQIEYARHSLGAVLNNGGVFTNGQAGGAASTASVSGYYYGVRVNSANTPNETGTVINFGTIDAPGGKGVSLVNGLLINGPSGATGALINAYVGVCVTESGTIVNYGSIANTGGGGGNYGILMVGGGTIANVGPASLIEGYTAIQAHSSTTVTNAGSIVSNRGASGVAIQFAAGTNLLVADPGAVFVGSLSAAGSTTLELASASSAGVLTGFGSSVTNFTSLVFDTGAQWTVAGDDSNDGLGTLTIGGFTFGDTIDLTGFAAASSTFASDTLVLTDGGGAHDTLHIQGSLVAGNFHLSSDGNGGTDIVFGAPPLLYGQTIDETGIVATSETVTAGVMTLMNGASTVGTIAVGTTLSTGDFILQPDGTGGTDVIVSSIFGTYTSGVTLVINPTSIVGTASITGTVASAVGVTGPSGTAWVLTNQGLVSETGAGSEGISFASNGSIINAGFVNGATVGIQLNAGGLVSNQSSGTISGVKGIYDRTAAATIVNSGSISGNVTSGSGIVINAGGTVTNLSGGTISGSYGINASSVAATVVNSGSIGDGSLLPTGAAIALKHGGLITNLAGGQIIAGLQGVYFGGAAGTIINAGSVGGGPATGNGIIFASVGAVTNQSGGVITGRYGVRAVSGAVTVTNAGSISGNLASGGGVNLAAGGSVTNQSGGTITGLKAVSVTGGTVTNAGSIGGNTAVATGAGVQLSAGGSFTNQSGGAVTGFAGVFSNAAATVVNAGNIGGNLVSGRGVSLTGSGSVTNQAGGVITGFDGILIVGSATVVNAGSIGGTTAVAFGAGVTNRLVIDPGAVFSGTVNGGNTIGAAFISTMELASGASAGTLSGLGTQFINFAASTIDAGANWTLSGANALAAGATLTNAGTLTDIGTLLNSGTITGNKLNLNGGLLNNQASGVLTATYVYGVAAGGTDTVINQGIITNSTGSAIYLAASGSVTNAAGGVIHGYGLAVKLSGTAAAVTNLGQIVGASESPSYGVYLRNGGLITNGQAGAGTSTASIQGYYGVTFKTADVVNAQGTLINYGTVIGTGTGASGVLLSNAGTVFNGQSGATAALIVGGRYGVSNGQGIVINGGTIIATGTASGSYGVGIQGVGGVANLGTASLIEGYGGILIGTDGIVLNAGTIASSQGTSGVAISFTDGNARLIDEPGAVFIGSIDGGSGGTAVLELASASSAGVISGLGGAVVNFTSLVFDSGAQWTVAGNDAASGLGTLGISGFVSGDTIDLTGFVAVSRTFASGTLVLTDGINAHETLHIQGGFATNNFHIASDGVGGTDVSFVTPPTIVAGGTVTFTGGGAPVTLDGSLTVTDGISTPLASGTVFFGTGFTAGDTLNFTAQNGISGSFSAETGTLTLTGSATIADYQAALDSITYSFSPGNGDPTAGGGDTSRTIDWVLSDGVAVSDIGTSSLTTVHVGPTITAGGTVAYATGGLAAVLDATVTVSDPDSAGLLTGGTVTVTAGTFDGDGDILSAITTGTSISLSYNAGSEILTLSGTDTLADYEAVLRSVAFHSSASDPTNGGDNPDRVISWTIGDGVSIAATGTSILDITRLPPVISGPVAGQTTTDEATVDPFAAVSVADPNSGQTETVTITLSNAANGTLSNLGGGTFNSGTYVVTGTTLAVTDAIEGLVFTPTAHQIVPGGTIATTFTIAVTDTNGVSVSDSTTTVIATAVNDAPVIAGAVGSQTVTDETTLSPFSGVSISDIDFGQTETVTVTLSNHLNGALSNLGGGSYDGVTGVYTVTGTDAAVTTAVDGLVFTPTAHQVAPGGSVATTFTIGVTDTAGGTSSNSTTTVTTTAVNDAPVIAGAVGGQTVSDEATLSPFSGVSISDVDFGQTETVTITLSNHLNGVLSNLGGGSYDGSTGVYSVTGSDAAVTTAVDGLVFTPAVHQVVPDASVTTTFTIGVTDTAGGTSSNSTTTVAATAVNDVPVIAGTVGGQTVTDETTVSPLSGVSIGDVDFGQAEMVTVTLSNHLNGALSNLGGGSYDGSTGVYTVTGSDAAVTTAVDGLVFTPTAHQVAPGGSVATTFTIGVTDLAGGTNSNSTTTVIATAVNDAPVISGAVGGQTVTDETTLSPFSGVSISDVDFGQTETVTVTLSNHLNGVLSNLGGGSYDGSTGVYTVTGSDAAVTTAVDGLVFTPTAHQVVPGGSVATTFTIGVTDTAGGTSSNSTTTVGATAVNDAPVISGAVGGQTVSDEATLSPFSGVSISDVDFGQTETVTVTLSNHLNGVLSNLGGGSYDGSTGVYSVTGSDAAVTTAVDGLVFTPAVHQVVPDASVTTTFTIGVTDTAGGTSSNSTTTVAATAVNDVPVIAGTVGGQTVTDETTVSPLSGVSIGDVDFGQTETVTVTLSNHLNGGLSNLGGGSYDGSTGVYTVTGSDAAVSTAVDGLVFTPTAHQVAPGSSVTTTFTIGVTDLAGGTNSNSTTTVIATEVNDAPVISGAVGGQTVTDETTLSPFSGVSISDVDFGQTETVTVTLSNHLNGVLSNLGGGSYDGSTGVYTVTGSDAAVTTALDGLVFTPTAHQVVPGGSVATTFTIGVTDTAGGTGSNTTTTVVATAVNDAPVISGAVGGQTVSDEATLSPLSGESFSDVDFGQTETVTVTLSNHLNGVLSNLGGGSYDGSTGVYSVTGSDAAVTTAVDGLVFTPTAHQVVPGASVTTTFTIGITDTAGGTSSNSTTTVAATAVNDVPVIAGTVGGQTVTDETTVSPLSGVSIGDVDFGQTETVTVTLSNHLNGVLSNLGDGSYDGSTGVYTVTGSDAAVTTALDGLVFTPTAHQVVPGGSVATTFTIGVTDTAGGISSDSLTTIVSTAVNDPPTITLPPVNTGVPNETGNTPFADLVIADPDVGHIDTVTVTLSDAAGGTLSNLGGGTYDSLAGVYSVTGTADAVTAALQGLAFTPAPPTTGFIRTTGFTVVVSGPGGTVSDSSLSVTSAQQVLGLAGNPTGNDAISVSPDGSTFNAPTLGQSNQAVVTAPSDGATYTLPTGYQAEFLGGSANATLSDPSGGNALLVGNSGNDTLMSGAGNDTILAGSGTNYLSASGSGDVIVAGGLSTVSVSGSGNLVLAGTGNTTVSSGGANTSVFGSYNGTAGNLTAALSGTDDLVSLGDSTGSVTTSGSGAFVQGGISGTTLTINDTGSHDVFNGLSSNEVATIGGSAAYLQGGTAGSTMTVVDTGTNDTINALASGMTVTASGSGLYVNGGSGPLSFVGGANASTIYGSSTGSTVTAGSGGVFFAANGTSNVASGPAGSTSTIFGAAGSSATVGGAGNLIYSASTGNATLNGASATGNVNAWLPGSGSGADSITTGSGNDTITAGAGSDTLNAGAGSNVFLFVAGHTAGATDFITDSAANIANDLFSFNNYGPTPTENLSGSQVTLTLSDNTTIVFTDLTSTSQLNGHINNYNAV